MRRTLSPTALDVVVVSCAVSAGVHVALVPEHMREAPQLGVAFGVSVVLLGGAVIALASGARAARMTALLLAGLLVAYAASRTTGIPWIEPDAEPVDAGGVAAKLAEAAGLLFALKLIHQEETP